MPTHRGALCDTWRHCALPAALGRSAALLAALGVCASVLRIWVALPTVPCMWEAQLCCSRHQARLPQLCIRGIACCARQRPDSSLCFDVPRAGSSAFGVTAPQPRGFERMVQCPLVCPTLLPCERSLTSLVSVRPAVSCIWKHCSIVHGTWMSLPSVISISSPSPAVLCVGMTSRSEVGTRPWCNCFAPCTVCPAGTLAHPQEPQLSPGNHAGCPDLGKEFSASPHISGAGVTPKSQLACNQLEVPQRCF